MRHLSFITALAALTLLILLPACAPISNDNETMHSCSPSYVDQNEFGRIAAQQAGPGAAVAWGVYPRKEYVRYVVRLYIGNRKLGGGKDQTYEPHGTVPAATVRAKGTTGSVFRIEGETYDAKGRVTRFFLRCRLA